MLSIIKHRQIIKVKATYIKYNFNVITFQTQAIPDFIPKLLAWLFDNFFFYRNVFNKNLHYLVLVHHLLHVKLKLVCQKMLMWLKYRGRNILC